MVQNSRQVVITTVLGFMQGLSWKAKGCVACMIEQAVEGIAANSDECTFVGDLEKYESREKALCLSL